MTSPEQGLEHYRRVVRADPGLGGPVCAAWCQGSPEQVAERHGADMTTGVPSDLDEAMSTHPEAATEGGIPPTVLLVGELGDGWCLAVEDYGLQACRPEVLRALTPEPGTRACSVFWSINLDNHVNLAEGGTVVAELSPFDGNDTLHGPRPAPLADALRGLPIDVPYEEITEVPDVDIKAAALLVGERLTGRRIELPWLTATHTRWLITDPAPEDQPNLSAMAAAAGDGQLARIAADPRPEHVPTLLHAYASLVATIFGLRGDETDRALALLAARTQGSADPFDAEQVRGNLRELADRLKAAGLVASDQEGTRDFQSRAWRLLRQNDIALALKEALRPDPAEALEATIWRAGSADWSEDWKRLAVIAEIFKAIQNGT